MTDVVTVAIIAAVPPTLAAFAAIIVSLINRQKTKADIAETKENIQKIHLEINSRMDELLKVSKSLARAEGHQEGKHQEKVDEALRKEKDC